MTAVTISVTGGVTSNIGRKLIALCNGLCAVRSVVRRVELTAKGVGAFLSETPTPFEDGVLTMRLGGFVHASPVNTKVGYNTLGLALDQLKRTDSGQLLGGEEGVIDVVDRSHETIGL